MKFHIVQVGEDINKICELYNMERETLEKLNPTINSRSLIVGEKLRIISKADTKIVEDISSLYTNIQEDDLVDEKYICPHCKNIILIPKK
jgi:predicted transport protein